MITSLCHFSITKSITDKNYIFPFLKLFPQLWKLRKDSFIFIECMNYFSLNTFCNTLFISAKTVDNIRNIRKIALIMLHKKRNCISTAACRKNYKRDSAFIQFVEAIFNTISQLKMPILCNIFEVCKSEF